jgi:hypothetical protein
MGTWFWIRRFFTVSTIAFAIIAGAHLLRGRSGKYAISEGLVWGLITAFIFTSTRLYRSRKGQHCAMCADTPEMQK